MKIVIVIFIVLTIAILAGFILGAVASEDDPMERELEDRDQIEYLREWHERRRRS